MRTSSKMAGHFVTIAWVVLVVSFMHDEGVMGDVQPAVLEIGPVAGLTTGWHPAPIQTGIPLGARVQLRIPAPSDALVVWRGAEEIMREEEMSVARVITTTPGLRRVMVEVADGNATKQYHTELDVIDIAVDDIVVSGIEVFYEPIEIDETLPPDEINALTMKYYFSNAIASITEIDEDSYLTSVARELPMQVRVTPAAFGPLMEWRSDGSPLWNMGVSGVSRFHEVGWHSVAVGPPAAEARIDVQTYAVTITNLTGEDIVEGEPVVFLAETEPRGYESEITWLSSTKYGSAIPVLGQGPVFVAQFDDTWGPDGSQWLGVKADNAAFGQDLKDLVPESEAVYLSEIPPDFYDRLFVPVEQKLLIVNAGAVQIQPPAHPENPYPYPGTFALYFDPDSGDFTAVFDAEGTFHLFVDGVFTTIFVGAPIDEEGGTTGKTGCTETFTPSGADLVISDEVGIDFHRFDYYEDELGQTMMAVDSVADAITKITAFVNDPNNGLLDKLTFANHGNEGFISCGDGPTSVPGKWFGKDANNMPIGAYAALVAGLQGKFNANAELCLVGCYVGEGDAGKNLVNSLATDIGGGITVRAKKGAVSYPLRWYGTTRYASSSGKKGWRESP